MQASDSIVFKLEDADGKLASVDASNLLVANSGNDLPVRIYHLSRPSIVVASLWHYL